MNSTLRAPEPHKLTLKPDWIYRSHIGLHFTDTDGSKVTCMSLVDRAGFAVAIADFRNLNCFRFVTTDAARVAALKWLDGLKSAPLSEMWGGK